jgi:hypothetical protein
MATKCPLALTIIIVTAPGRASTVLIFQTNSFDIRTVFPNVMLILPSTVFFPLLVKGISPVVVHIKLLAVLTDPLSSLSRARRVWIYIQSAVFGVVIYVPNC